MHAMLQGCDESEPHSSPAVIDLKSEFVTRLWQEAEDISRTEENCISAATLSKVFITSHCDVLWNIPCTCPGFPDADLDCMGFSTHALLANVDPWQTHLALVALIHIKPGSCCIERPSHGSRWRRLGMLPADIFTDVCIIIASFAGAHATPERWTAAEKVPYFWR